MSASRIAVLGLVAAAMLAGAAPAGEDAQALLEKTGVKGGLCLVIGAKDPTLAQALVAKSGLYVQVLQSDAKLAGQWGLEFAASASRENLGVREAAFDPEHYGSDLFNLVVVEDPAAAGKATLADFERLLVPGGVVAFRDGAGVAAAAAKASDLTAVAAPPFAAAFRKVVREIPFKPSETLKWRAGARAHWSSGWSNYGSAGSVFYYTEKLEVAGDPQGGNLLLSVRDAFNGRLLWTMDWARVLAGTRDGRLFVIKDKLVVCDARTGAVPVEIPADGFEKGVRWGLSAGDNMAILGGSGPIRAYSSDGKMQWQGSGGGVHGASSNRLFILGGNTLRCLELKDGKQLWKSPAAAEWDSGRGGAVLLSDKYVYAVGNWASLIVAFEQETGKEVWRYTNQPPKGCGSYYHVLGNKVYAATFGRDLKGDSDLTLTTLDSATGAVESKDVGPKARCIGYMCAPIVHGAGDYIFYSFCTWLDPKTMKLAGPYFAHPSCGFGTYLANGMAYSFPSRKFGPLQGISAIAPADLTFDHEVGGKAFQKYSDAPARGEVTRADDWVMFRGNPSRSNSTKAAPGDKLAKLWEVSLGAGANTFGRMNSIRSGLTQAASAWGMAIVADMEGQRIVALDAATGKEKWTFPVGSRVEFSPTLYKGLCLFAAKDGWVYCLDARTGVLCWKRMIPAQVRLIGGQDKLESLWPVTSDVMIENGVGYACAGLNGDLLGGIRAIGFRPETGELVWGQCYTKGVASLFVGTGNAQQVFMYNSTIDSGTGKMIGGRSWPGGSGCLSFNNPIDDYLAGGVSLQRNGEDRQGVQLANGIIQGKTVAFDEGLSVAFMGAISQQQWEKGWMTFFAKSKRGKENLWEVKDDLIVDDIVVSPGFVYVVGHHYREAKPPELRVVSREDGKTLAAHELNTAFPAWNGMSVAGDKIFIATGEGRLICFGKQ